MSFPTLEDCRKAWEKDLKPVAVITNPQVHNETLAVLKRPPGTRDGKPDYFCHRYFPINESWDISVDSVNVDADTALKWVAIRII